VNLSGQRGNIFLEQMDFKVVFRRKKPNGGKLELVCFLTSAESGDQISENVSF
jgi:hypothetical protein